MPTTSNDVVKIFSEKFTTTPRLFFSPGRINLIGEHVDYNDGFVMPAAIDKGIWYAIAANGTDTASFFSVDENEKLEIALPEITPIPGWKNYVLGVVDQVKKGGLPLGGFDCVFGGDIPIGAGMSSSAAVEGGLLYALNEVFGFKLDRVTMALMAQKAEHTFPGVKCGIMDMFASLMGKMNNVLLLNCLTMQYEYLPLQLDEYSIVLINSKVHHSLAGSAYNKRRQECAEGFKILQENLDGIKSYQDVKPADVQHLEHLLGHDVYKRCLFVTQEIERTQKAAAFLKENNHEAFGQLMFDTHEGLSKLYEVSCPELDFLVAQARNEPSIIGSRVMGGGFGGCTINLIRTKDWPVVAERITNAYRQQFNIAAEVYDMATSNGTYEAAQA